MSNDLESAIDILRKKNFKINPECFPQERSNDFSFKNIRPKKYLNQDIHRIRSECRSKGSHFFDSEFPRSILAIASEDIVRRNNEQHFVTRIKNLFAIDNTNKKIDDEIIWQRVYNITESLHKNRNNTEIEVAFVADSSGKPYDYQSRDVDKYVSLFDSLDSYQGLLGDCWLISGLMALAKNKELIKWIIPIDNADPERMKLGAYYFRFWNYGEWHEIVIDDYLPTTKSNNLLFCYNNDERNEFWPSLLEKAFAKIAGCYYDMEGGRVESVITMLSGGFHENYRIDDETNQIKFYQQKIEMKQLYDIIKIALERNFAISCASRKDTDKIKTAHAYIITDCAEVNSVLYLKLHNPHNKEQYKNTSEYERIKDLIEKGSLKKAEKGEFWMQYKNFIHYFSSVNVHNLLPKASYEKKNEYAYLKDKTSIINSWEIRNFVGTIRRRNDEKKYLINITNRDKTKLSKAKVRCMIVSATLPFIYKKEQRVSGRIDISISKNTGNCDNLYSLRAPYNQQNNLSLMLDAGQYILKITFSTYVSDKEYMLRLISDAESDLNVDIQRA